jgi:hypothetical protein
MEQGARAEVVIFISLPSDKGKMKVKMKKTESLSLQFHDFLKWQKRFCAEGKKMNFKY